MNAYELADLIGLCGDGGYNQDAANMLRQQADEIVVLKRILVDEGITVGYDYLNDCVAMLRRAKQ